MYRLDIRLATFKDIEPMCRLYNAFFAYNAGLRPEYCKASQESGDYPQSVIASENADIFVAVEGDAPVGFIHIRKAQTPPFDSVVPRHYAEIIDFFVSDSHREKGLGSKLMEAAKQWSIARNLDYIELSVLSNAKEALCFYEHKDFVTVLHTMRCVL